ncbi:hypothetical protein GSI_01950 [Ganoderma sinense ZZ0214-1]|uniref:GDP/GTP exchange factor Sec2 N-terminal domain-containing protein n=1 Tax=Ganoderma sinense ZZ0214-1 TaxID=1077348 RepID=A0A2G8SR94_9APHY|nr:hypothetical protein GSI_01950 [Ganoderma sinense ZZ0214-1]
MLHMSMPYQVSATNRNLPRRSDSLLKVPTTTIPYFSELDDELRDIRRVHSQGQEEDLRYALSRTINRIEELTSMLKEAYKAQTDLQTELTLAKSNLTMALANNEMLEDALKRDHPSHSKDVGWRRMSAREQSLRVESEAERRRSTDSLATDLSSSPTPSQPPSAVEHSPVVPRSATMPSPAPPSSTTESRFFRFRFGNGSSSASRPSSPRLSAGQSPMLNGSHLTSASLPSLVPPKEDKEKEVEELQHQLEVERKARKDAADAKVALEAEIESLSQALFEEANKMVATERMKLAETEEQLREAREQGEALKNVLRLFERDTEAARTRTHVVDRILEDDTISFRSRRHRASSSAVGIKSPSSGIPSPQQSRSTTPSHSPSDVPSSARTVVAGPSSSPSTPPPKDTDESTDRHDLPGAKLAVSVSTDSESSTLSTSTTLRISPSPPPTSSPHSPSHIPSPLTAPGQFLFTPARAVSYFDGEESPWADATSASTTSPKVST